nr:putative ribonuclease H-like domain-containing protein [Tanacetum cinerariifolium]
MIDYALWEVIENGPTFPKTQVVEGVTTEVPITTAEEKAQRRLEVKERSTLMMGISNEHQLKFNSIKDAKKLLEAIEKRFGGNATTKKTHRNLLKHQYENFTALSLEMLDQTFDRLQKLRNKVDLDTMSMDDLYNNLKVYEPEGRKLTVNGNETISFNNVECYNCHKMGHFARECRALRKQDNKNKESLRRSVPVETFTLSVMVLVDMNGVISLNKLIECQIVDNFKKGLGYENYNVVPPLYIGNFMPLTPDLSFTGLDEFFNKLVVENLKAKSSEEEPNIVRKNDDALIIEEWVSDNKEEDVSQPKIKKKTVRPSIAKIEFVKSKQQEKTTKKTVKQVAQHRQNTHNPRGNQRNWNNMMSQKLGSNFEMFNKACYVCGSFDHLQGNPQIDLQVQGVIASECSRHMTENMSYLTDYEEIDKGYVAFPGNPKGEKIIGKRVHRKNNMYSVDLKNIVPKEGLTFLFAKVTSDESKLLHRRLGHLNFKTMNKLVKGNLVRGLPSKLFENDQTCVACQKRKQHRASCKPKTENSISLPLHLLHMDLLGLTFVKSLMKKMYCLVVTNDYSRFT